MKKLIVLISFCAFIAVFSNTVVAQSVTKEKSTAVVTDKNTDGSKKKCCKSTTKSVGAKGCCNKGNKKCDTKKCCKGDMKNCKPEDCKSKCKKK